MNHDTNTARGRLSTTLWEAEVDAMYERMQTAQFAEAARRILDEPVRVPVPEHLRRGRRR
jgi:hypothetical protein